MERMIMCKARKIFGQTSKGDVQDQILNTMIEAIHIQNPH